MKLFEFPELTKPPGKQAEQDTIPPQAEVPPEQSTREETKPLPAQAKQATATEWKPSVQV